MCCPNPSCNTELPYDGIRCKVCGYFPGWWKGSRPKYFRIYRSPFRSEEQRQEPIQEEDDEHQTEPPDVVPAGPGNGDIATNIPSGFRRDMRI